MSSRFPPSNNPPPPPPSPFGQRPNPPSPPSFPPSPNRPTPPSSPFGQRPPTPPATPGSLLQRMGSKVNWTLLPIVDEIACFDLSALAVDSLRALGIPIANDTLGNLLRMIKENQGDVQALVENLEQSWQSCELHGAALVYNWRDDLREGMAARLVALKQPPIFLRVTDPLLVLNVLARARASLLLANAPLALEYPYLSRVLASDDPRLLELARSQGCTRELLVAAEAQPGEDDE